MNVTDLLNEVQKDLRTGGRARRDMSGSKEPVWPTLDGLYSAGRFFEVSETDAMDFTAITVSDTGTPATEVPKGTPKPNAASVASAPHSLAAYAGYCTLDTRTLLGAQNLAGAVLGVLRRQGVRAFEDDVAAVIDGGSTPSGALGTSFLENIAAAQAQLIAKGGVPDVIAVNADDYGQLVGAATGAAGLSGSRDDGVLTILGSAIYLNPALTGCHVADSSAVSLVAHSSGLVVDAGTDSGSTNSNKVTILAESFLLAVAGNDGIVGVTVPTPVAARKK